MVRPNRDPVRDVEARYAHDARCLGSESHWREARDALYVAGREMQETTRQRPVGGAAGARTEARVRLGLSVVTSWLGIIHAGEMSAGNGWREVPGDKWSGGRPRTSMCGLHRYRDWASMSEASDFGD